jgi:hypothetical protein
MQEEEAVGQAQMQKRAALESLASAEADAALQRQLLTQLVGGLAGMVPLGSSLQHVLAHCESPEALAAALQQLQKQVSHPGMVHTRTLEHDQEYITQHNL